MKILWKPDLRIFRNFFSEHPKFKISKVQKYWIFKDGSGWKPNFRLLAVLYYLIVGFTSKTGGGVAFLEKVFVFFFRSTANSLLIVAKIVTCMGGHINPTFTCVKFGDDPVSSLDFSFSGEVALIQNW